MSHPILACVLSALAVALTVQEPIPPALQKMADTERAFARRAEETTVRDAFIEFFADESIGFEPDPVPARASLRKRPPPPPSPVKRQLLWEPRYGDIAASGDLGYLTGPSEQIPPGKAFQFGNYFSIWKKQADGEFRVILDVGARTPEKPVFAPGFTRARGVAQWKGTASRADNDASLTRADTALSGALTHGAPAAYEQVLHDSARFMRNAITPLVTRTAIVAWLRTHVTSMNSTPQKAETAAAGDLGYTWGRVTEQRADGKTEAGYYVRVWTRKADGTWQLVAEVATGQ